MLPELTPIQHATAVGNELIDAIENVLKETKKTLLSNIEKAIRTIEYNPILPIHPVSPPPTIEGGRAETEVGDERKSFPRTQVVVMTTNDPTAPRVLLVKNRTYLRTTRNNTQGMLLNIETETVPDQRSERWNLDAIVIDQKAVMPI